jgi:hypothetical protein
MRRLLGLAVIAALGAPLATLEAQAGFYPALQPSRIAVREYTFAVADLSGGTALVGQWREGLGRPGFQLTVDGGIVDADAAGSSTQLVLGAGVAYQVMTSTADLPFDIVLGGGLGVSLGGGHVLRIPLSATVGHRFVLPDGVAISPFVAPRLSWNRASAAGVSASDTDIEVDLGATVEMTPTIAMRVAAILGDNNAFALGLALTPKGLKR